MKYLSSLLLLSAVTFITGCKDDDGENMKSIHELEMKAEIILPEKGDDIYASWLYLASGLKEVYDNPLFDEEVIELTLSNPGEGTRIGLQMQACDVADDTYMEVISGTGAIVSLRFPVIWKLEALRKWKLEASIALSWQVTLDGADAGVYKKEFVCHSVEDCVVRLEFEQIISGTKAMYAGYVEEDNPILETLIRESLQLGPALAFTDYQRGKENVLQQLFTIWNALENRGIKVLQPNNTEEKRIQKIRSINQILASKSGSEEEIAILLTTICQKIGFCTTLETNPDGAYVGIADNFYNQDPELIYFLDVSRLTGRLENSRSGFESALSSGMERYKEDEQARLTDPTHYEEIWIDPVRLHVPSLSLSRN